MPWNSCTWHGVFVGRTRTGFARRTGTVLGFAVAMAYLESACVAYLQKALGIVPTRLFPVLDPADLGGFAAIEVGREAATLVMLWSLGWLLGRSGVERLAWTSIAFGVWDIAYYGWLVVFLDWPTSLGTWDLLFLIPGPWAGPVWAPMAVSVALIGFGLAVVKGSTAGHKVRLNRAHWLGLILGGLITVWAFMWNAPLILDGGVPTAFPAPLFALGMTTGIASATDALRR